MLLLLLNGFDGEAIDELLLFFQQLGDAVAQATNAAGLAVDALAEKFEIELGAFGDAAQGFDAVSRFGQRAMDLIGDEGIDRMLGCEIALPSIDGDSCVEGTWNARWRMLLRPLTRRLVTSMPEVIL